MWSALYFNCSNSSGRLEVVSLFPVLLLTHLLLLLSEAGVGADHLGDVLAAGEAGGEAAGHLERGGYPNPGEEGGPDSLVLLLADQQEGVVEVARLTLPLLALNTNTQLKTVSSAENI